MTSTPQEKFNIGIVQEKFEEALHEEDDVNLALYLESFKELNKFFDLLGGVFGFVSSEINEKIGHLNTLLNESETSDKFKTVKTMIEHEQEMNLLNKDGYISGSRTLLRVHRGLDFMRLFLKKIGELKDEDGTSAVCREAYNETLGNYHPWLIRQGAKLAMYTLPTKQCLLQTVCGEEDEIERAVKLLPKTLESTGMVYTRIDNLYTTYDLHTLP